MHTTKERKIFDCFFYHDEKELLELRLKLHNEHVDFFILIEFSQSFDFEEKKIYLDLQDEKFIQFSEKIIHLKIPFIDGFEIKRIFEINKHFELLRTLPQNKKNDFLFYASYLLTDEIIKKKPKIQDLIFISDIDELIDFSSLTEIIDNLKYGTVFLKQKNFIWSENYFLKDNYEGTFVLEFSQILRNKNKIIISHLIKNEKKFTKNIVSSGWHLSHFYDIDRTFEKLNLIYPELRLTREIILESFRKLENPIPNNFKTREKLVKNKTPLPFSVDSLEKQFIGRPVRKIIITWKKTLLESKIYDKILNLSESSELLPTKIFYGEYDLKTFHQIFTLNQINYQLQKLNLLDDDLIFFRVDELREKFGLIFPSGTEVFYKWEILQEKIPYDFLLENSISPD